MRILATAVLILMTLGMQAQAEPRQSTERNRNYILRRQEAGLVSGTPTIRRIIGKREIDVYRNGLMFEGDNVVGVSKR
jgi:DNA invertase Pin-like site-specific DNA recombinase